jgi:hypothetical protein
LVPISTASLPKFVASSTAARRPRPKRSQNRPDRVGNLISGRRRSDGSAPASASSNSGEFLFNGA